MNTQIQSFPLPIVINLAPDEATATFIPIDRAEALAARLTQQSPRPDRLPLCRTIPGEETRT